MKLLVSDPEFQRLVAEIRGHLGIPVDGFNSNAELIKWHEQFITKCDAVAASKNYNERGRAIVADYEAKRIDFEEYLRRKNAHREEIPVNYHGARIQFIIDKFDLPENFDRHIDEYIVFGKVGAPYHNFVLGPWHDRRPGQKFSELRYIPVTFYTIPTTEDLRLVKREVEMMAKRHGLRKFHAMKNVDRDLTVEKWQRNPERVDVVEQTTYKMTKEEIAAELLGSARKAGSIKGIVQELGRARKKRFRPSRKK